MLRFQFSGDPADLAALLRAGFQVEAVTGCTLREFLCIEMEICGDYANRRIQTIFINGRPVDDFDTAQIEDGTELALSGAMPGLVGAMLRRGGGLAHLRDSISYNLNELRPHETRGVVHLRLYNFIAEELAHIFLRRGVSLETGKVAHILAEHGLPLDGMRREAENGDLAPVTEQELAALLDREDRVFITTAPTLPQ